MQPASRPRVPVRPSPAQAHRPGWHAESTGRSGKSRCRDWNARARRHPEQGVRLRSHDHNQYAQYARPIDARRRPATREAEATRGKQVPRPRTPAHSRRRRVNERRGVGPSRPLTIVYYQFDLLQESLSASRLFRSIRSPPCCLLSATSIWLRTEMPVLGSTYLSQSRNGWAGVTGRTARLRRSMGTGVTGAAGEGKGLSSYHRAEKPSFALNTPQGMLRWFGCRGWSPPLTAHKADDSYREMDGR